MSAIKPDHYRRGKIDLYESWYQTYPFNEFRAIMQAIAERYARRDKKRQDRRPKQGYLHVTTVERV